MAVFLICLLWTCVVFAFLVSFLAKGDDFQSAVEALRRLPPLARAVFVIVVSGAIVFGGSKPDGAKPYDFNDWFTSGAPDEGPALSDAQKAAGFALVAADTNVVFDFSAPTNATVHEAWLKRGAAVDGFPLKPYGWSFMLGTNTVDSVYVSSSGTVALDELRLSSPDGHAMPDPSGVPFPAPLRTSLGIVPEGNWHLLPDSAHSLFWHDVTQRGSSRFTWRNALLGRSTNAPVSFQTELFPNGDFIYRYDLSSLAPCPLPLIPYYVIGAQAYNGGETALASLPGFACSPSNHICSVIWRMEGTNVTSTPLCEAIGDALRFELRWTAFGKISGDDTDFDGVPDAHEILLHHTDPHLADTDGDGLSDGDEIASGLNPLDPDEDGDGIPDGVPTPEWFANPLWGGNAGMTNLVVTLLEPLPDETKGTLAIGGLRLLLSSVQNWSLYLPPGGEYPFAVSGGGDSFVKLAATGPSLDMEPMEASTPLDAQSGDLDAAPTTYPSNPESTMQPQGITSWGAFVLDDPSGFFSAGAVPNGWGRMGFVTIDLEAGIAPLCVWGGGTSASMAVKRYV